MADEKKESLIVFVKSFDGKAKETGREFHCYTLAQLKLDDNGVLNAYVKDFYSDKPLDVKSLNFGDVVEPDFADPEFFGGKPVLCGIEKLLTSPFIVSKD